MTATIVKEARKETSDITREEAGKINPLIGSMSADTTDNLIAELSFLQQFSLNAGRHENMTFSPKATTGYYHFIECMIAALEYEGEAQS